MKISEIEFSDFKKEWHFPTARSNKYRQGVVGFLTGSKEFPGAAVLGATAAMFAGVGMVKCFGTPEVNRLVLQSRPEVIAKDLAGFKHTANLAAEKLHALVVGSGIDRNSAVLTEAMNFLIWARGCGVAAVLDAGALSLVPTLLEMGKLPSNFILTPHQKELHRLLDSLGQDIALADIEEQPEEVCKITQENIGGVLVLKGATSWVSAGTNTLFKNEAQSNYLAQAGTGDVLAGIIGAAVAAKVARTVGEVDPLEIQKAAALSVAIHSQACPNRPTPALELCHKVADIIELAEESA